MFTEENVPVGQQQTHTPEGWLGSWVKTFSPMGEGSLRAGVCEADILLG